MQLKLCATNSHARLTSGLSSNAANPEDDVFLKPLVCRPIQLQRIEQERLTNWRSPTHCRKPLDQFV